MRPPEPSDSNSIGEGLPRFALGTPNTAPTTTPYVPRSPALNPLAQLFPPPGRTRWPRPLTGKTPGGPSDGAAEQP